MKKYTLQDIKRRNNAAHYHFFDSLFQQAVFIRHVYPVIYQGPGGIFFITSEKFAWMPTVFSIRQFDPANGYITTARDHFGYTSRSDAIKCAQALAKGLDKSARLKP